jgi:putative DNA primase/helicase
MIPQELKELKQWVNWEPETKIPLQPKNNEHADPTNPAHWGSYDEAIKNGENIGFVFTEKDPFIGIDLDGAFDLETGEIAPWAVETLNEINSFTEWSQSKTGFHIIVKSSQPLPERPGKKGTGREEKIDKKHTGHAIYDRQKYFALTGDIYAGREEIKTVDVMPFYNRIWSKKDSTKNKPNFDNEIYPESYTQDEIDGFILEAFSAKDGPKFRDLWNNTWQNKYGYDADHSRASQALCNLLRYWFGRNPDILREVYQQSQFYTCGDYRDADRRSEIDIAKAISDGEVCPRLQIAEDDNDDLSMLPKPLLEIAYIGALGRIVTEMEPYTELSREALLFSFMPFIGTVLSDKVFIKIANTKHPTNLFIVTISPTGGGKGTATGIAYNLFNRLWEYPIKTVTGISSGEALIYEIRDDRQVTVKTKEGYSIETEPGVSDKRLLIVFEELSTLLTVKGREGNTLGDKLKEAWECRPLSCGSKASPERCRHPRISILGNTQPKRIADKLTRDDIESGLGNRFLFAWIKSNKYKPDGGNVPEEIMEKAANQLSNVIERAENMDEVVLGYDARQLWNSIYPELKDLPNEMQGRARPYILKMAMLYALCDDSEDVKLAQTGDNDYSMGILDNCFIRRRHLEAALEIWRYNWETICFTLADNNDFATKKKISKDGQKILDGMKKPMSQSEIANEIFGKNKKIAEIKTVLLDLIGRGLIVQFKEKTGGRGRDKVVFQKTG